jgi:TonB family protein
MTRLQKKCLIAVAGTHLMLVVLVLCSGFFKPTPKPDDTQVLDVISANAIDKIMNSGMRNAVPPPPAPPVKPQEPTPTPPTPQPQKQVEPVKPVEPTQPPERAPLDVPKPDETIPKPPKHEVKVDLTPVVRKTTDQTQKNDDEAKKEEQREMLAAKKAQQARIRAIENAAHTIEKNTSTAMTVDVPGDSTASYANFGAIVVSVYHHAWVSPENMTSESAVVSFSVTIARDGTVVSSHITSPSGDVNIDNAVQRMLDRVNFIHQFPDDTTDRERTYTIDFNATKNTIQ